jgi:hypothetical protein
MKNLLHNLKTRLLNMHLGILALLETSQTTLAHRRRNADSGFADVGHLATIALTIVVVILGAYVAITVLASLIAPFASAVKNISANFTTADWGNTTANSLGPIFGLVISLLGMFAIVGLVLYSMNFKSYRGGGGDGV